jgi:hypothetical protein
MKLKPAAPPPLPSGIRFPEITFGRTVYRINLPPNTWAANGPDEHPWCSSCHEGVMFVFPAKLDSAKAGICTYYINPVTLRCGCSLGPVTISPV